jgi:hypothetical protein
MWIFDSPVLPHFVLTVVFFYPALKFAGVFTQTWEGQFQLCLSLLAIVALTWEACQLEIYLRSFGYNWQNFFSYWWLDTCMDLFATFIGAAVAVLIMILTYRVK